MAADVGEILLRGGILTQERLERAQLEQERSGRPLAEMLLRLGYCEEEQLQRALAETLGIPAPDPETLAPDADALSLISAALAQKHQLVPLSQQNGALTVALAEPLNLTALDDVRLVTGLQPQPVYADADTIRRLILESYVEDEGEGDDVEVIQEGEDNVVELQRLAREALVVRLVNNILRDAVRQRASDVHVETFEDRVQVRFRIDGVLHEMSPPPQRMVPAIISRIKILSDLDIAERRLPQDGRIRMHVAGHNIDIRVSIVPTLHGEAVVMRLLDQTTTRLDLDDLGFVGKDRTLFEHVIRRPHGMVLVTGPTGSGKTTTLYASLKRIYSSAKKIITIEDPVEYQFEGINQIQVRENIGLTFARGLRSIIRQDPDIIMVGEIRDVETADISIHAALTGHLVFSTLHTNDAPGAVPRLLDMGVEPYLAASSIEAVMGQRLARKLCPDCKEDYEPPVEDGLLISRELQIDPPQTLKRGTGCSRCRFTGYTDRIGLFELMLVTSEIRQLILEKVAASQIKALAQEQGMSTLREDGWRKVLDGQTSIEEVLRVTTEDE